MFQTIRKIEVTPKRRLTAQGGSCGYQPRQRSRSPPRGVGSVTSPSRPQQAPARDTAGRGVHVDMHTHVCAHVCTRMERISAAAHGTHWTPIPARRRQPGAMLRPQQPVGKFNANK